MTSTGFLEKAETSKASPWERVLCYMSDVCIDTDREMPAWEDQVLATTEVQGLHIPLSELGQVFTSCKLLSDLTSGVSNFNK